MEGKKWREEERKILGKEDTKNYKKPGNNIDMRRNMGEKRRREYKTRERTGRKRREGKKYDAEGGGGISKKITQ